MVSSSDLVREGSDQLVDDFTKKLSDEFNPNLTGSAYDDEKKNDEESEENNEQKPQITTNNFFFDASDPTEHEVDIQKYFVRENTFINEPVDNIRAGKDCADIRFIRNPYNHGTPSVLDIHKPDIYKYLDIDGYPYKKTKDYEWIAPAVTVDEAQFLKDENPHVLESFRRVRNDEYKWMILNRRTKRSTPNWILYILGCGPLPGDLTGETEWEPRKQMEERRQPPQEEDLPAELTSSSVRKPRSAKMEPSQVEFTKQIFSKIKDNTGRISKEKAIDLGYIWGYIPTETDKKNLKDMVNERDFFRWLGNIICEDEQDLAGLKSVFDCVVSHSNDKLLSKYYFDTILTEMGEMIDHQLLDKILKLTGASVQNGKLSYQSFIEELFSQNQEVVPRSAYTAVGILSKDMPEEGSLCFSTK